MKHHYPVLYIHPYGHLNDFIIPAGAISVVNSFDTKCLGLYSFEVKKSHLENAKIVIMDFHWALGYVGLYHISKLISRKYPHIKIIIGGISASVWNKHLFSRLPIDYLIQGDAEVSTKLLVDYLLDDKEPPEIPNVWSRNGKQPKIKRLNRKTFSDLDTLSCDWFPSYKISSQVDVKPFTTSAHIIVSRGCVNNCKTCYGSYKGSFGDGILYHTASSITKAIYKAKASGHKSIRFFMGLTPEKIIAEFLSKVALSPISFKKGLGIYTCTPFSSETMSLLRKAFPETQIAISMLWPSEREGIGFNNDNIEKHEDECARMSLDSNNFLSVEYWYCEHGTDERIAQALSKYPGSNAKAKNGYVWNLARAESHDDDTIDSKTNARKGSIQNQQLEDSIYISFMSVSYHLARSLSQPLRELLDVFQSLDDLKDDPENVAPPEDIRSVFWDEVMHNWRRFGFPLLPELDFSLYAAEIYRNRNGSACKIIQPVPANIKMVETEVCSRLELKYDHRSPMLTAQISKLPENCNIILIVPSTKGMQDKCREYFLSQPCMAVTSTDFPKSGKLTLRFVAGKIMPSFVADKKKPTA